MSDVGTSVRLRLRILLIYSQVPTYAHSFHFIYHFAKKNNNEKRTEIFVIVHLHDNEKIEGKKCEILIITHLSLLRKKNCGKMSLIFCLERTRSNKQSKMRIKIKKKARKGQPAKKRTRRKPKHKEEKKILRSNLLRGPPYIKKWRLAAASSYPGCL